jgi:hypothetical protein
MNETAINRRIVAFDIRPQKLGHVILEGPSRLIDYGVARFRESDRQVNRVEYLIATFRPSIAVLLRVEKGSWRDRAALRTMMRSVRRRIRTLGTAIVQFRAGEVKRVLRVPPRGTKELSARLVVEHLPELTWQLPPHRRLWQPEHWRMPIFDAAALALAYFILEMDQNVSDEGRSD